MSATAIQVRVKPPYHGWEGYFNIQIDDGYPKGGWATVTKNSTVRLDQYPDGWYATIDNHDGSETGYWLALGQEEADRKAEVLRATIRDTDPASIGATAVQP